MTEKQERAAKLKTLLAGIGIATKSIDFLGAGVIVTCHCRNSAERVARVMAAGGFVMGLMRDSLDETADSTEHDRKYVKVVRVSFKVSDASIAKAESRLGRSVEEIAAEIPGGLFGSAEMMKSKKS